MQYAKSFILKPQLIHPIYTITHGIGLPKTAVVENRRTTGGRLGHLLLHDMTYTFLTVGDRVRDQVKFDPFQTLERLQTFGNLIL